MKQSVLYGILFAVPGIAISLLVTLSFYRFNSWDFLAIHIWRLKLARLGVNISTNTVCLYFPGLTGGNFKLGLSNGDEA